MPAKDLGHLFTRMTPWCSWQLWQGSFGRQRGWDQHHLSDNLLIRASSVEVMLPFRRPMLVVVFCEACQIVSATGSFRGVFLAHFWTGLLLVLTACWMATQKKDSLIRAQRHPDCHTHGRVGGEWKIVLKKSKKRPCAYGEKYTLWRHLLLP